MVLGLGRKIEIARLSNNMNQGELAKLIGSSRNTIVRYEADKTIPKMDKLLLIGKATGKDLSFFYGNEVVKFNLFGPVEKSLKPGQQGAFDIDIKNTEVIFEAFNISKKRALQIISMIREKENFFPDISKILIWIAATDKLYNIEERIFTYFVFGGKMATEQIYKKWLDL